MGPRILLWTFAGVYVARFAWPALVSAGGGAPFGEPWLTDPAAGTPLLDSDLRYFGVACLTIAALFVVASFQVERLLVAVDLVMLFVLLGACVRTAEIALVGVPPPPAVVAAVVEWVVPALWFWSVHDLRRRRRVRLQRSTQVARPAADVWAVFANFGAVDAWHPYMESAQLEAGPERGVGAARVCKFGPRLAIRETVTMWDDAGGMEIAIDFVRGLAPPITDVRAGVRVEPLAEDRSRLTLTMAYTPTAGPIGSLLNEVVVVGQYERVFESMLAAASAWAEDGRAAPQIAMPGSGRRLAPRQG